VKFELRDAKRNRFLFMQGDEPSRSGPRVCREAGEAAFQRTWTQSVSETGYARRDQLRSSGASLPAIGVPIFLAMGYSDSVALLDEAKYAFGM